MESDLTYNFNTLLEKRDYYGLFQLITEASSQYLSEGMNDYTLCIQLITYNQDLLEYMGASKHFEGAYDLQDKLTANRNQLFLSCFNESQQDLKVLFKRMVGDHSK